MGSLYHPAWEVAVKAEVVVVATLTSIPPVLFLRLTMCQQDMPGPAALPWRDLLEIKRAVVVATTPAGQGRPALVAGHRAEVGQRP
jgi:hypothetical protein